MITKYADERVQALRDNLARVILGKHEAIERLIIGLLCNGHILIEDVPGVGKTTLARALALSIHADFRRLQFTPDLLPTDIVGGMVYWPTTGEFTFRPGPVFCNILLADEINRASPRTQSALLESMNEHQVTVDGKSYPLPKPFLVIATQNPIENQGTYPLPEAELDRFAMQIRLGYAEAEEEVAVLTDRRESNPLDKLQPVMDLKELMDLQASVRRVGIEKSVARYLVEVVRATRVDPRVLLGGSTRAVVILSRTCQARACLEGRTFVTPDDVKAQVEPVLAHRLTLDRKARHAGVVNSAVLCDIVESMPVPV